VLRLAPEVRADLVLAGHTHGGQVVLPGYGAPLRLASLCGRRTARGWVPNARAPLYVSAGLGTMIPLRVNCPPEIVVVRLRVASTPRVRSSSAETTAR
jgi:predicted MPP superfamily phosphohydrolase